jgi:single-strand DNA-binding protein
MFLNSVTLMGFLGGNPDRRQTKNDNPFAVLSLATKTSWKNKQTGEWESRTEWHHGIVYGRLADFAATLKKERMSRFRASCAAARMKSRSKAKRR